MENKNIKRAVCTICAIISVLFAVSAWANNNNGNTANADVSSVAQSTSLAVSGQGGSAGAAVNIDSHSRSKFVNRQFMPFGNFNFGGVMQDFVDPAHFGTPWNYRMIKSGWWKRIGVESEEEIKLEMIKMHHYATFPSCKKVHVVVDKVRIVGSHVGEISAKASAESDTRSLMLALIDKLASWGANVIAVRVNGTIYEPESTYEGFILGGNAGGIYGPAEKIASSGGGGVGKGSNKLTINYHPVMIVDGYRGRIVEIETEMKKNNNNTEKSKKLFHNHGKEWQEIAK
jgi:hypothetical protein